MGAAKVRAKVSVAVIAAMSAARASARCGVMMAVGRSSLALVARVRIAADRVEEKKAAAAPIAHRVSEAKDLIGARWTGAR